MKTVKRAVKMGESEKENGPAEHLGDLCAMRMDVQQARLAARQRGIASVEAALDTLEDQLDRQIGKVLRAHVLWPWLSAYKGLGGVQTARLISLIDNPHRFPGRLCAAGHHHPAVEGEAAIGAVHGCGVDLADGTTCTAQIGPLRPGTGTRSLWHYLGLHVVNGKSPRKAKGKRSDWSPAGRTMVLMPGGIADSIVKARTAHYRDIYDATKVRLAAERGADRSSASEQADGFALLPIETAEADARLAVGAVTGLRPSIETAEADVQVAIGSAAGLRPFQIDNIAKKVAAKAFVADLLAAWKHLLPVEGDAASVEWNGREETA